MPLFSIITVCLNVEQQVIKTCQSILRQTETNFEWIVIDGGSTDNTISFLEQQEHVTHLVSEPDEGIYDAMNKGINLAKGKYCLFLNAGDTLFDSNVLEAVKKDLNKDLVVGRIQMIYPETGMTEIRQFDLQDIRSKYLYSKTLPHQATFIRSRLFEEYGFYDSSFKIIGDYDFFARVLLHGASLGFSSICIATYPLDGLSSELKGSDLFLNELAFLRKKNFSLSYRLWRKGIDFCEPRLLQFAKWFVKITK